MAVCFNELRDFVSVYIPDRDRDTLYLFQASGFCVLRFEIYYSTFPIKMLAKANATLDPAMCLEVVFSSKLE